MMAQRALEIYLQAVVIMGLLCFSAFGALCLDKYRMIPGHTACLKASSNLDTSKPRGVTQKDREHIVKEHNRYRGLVQPPAANMEKMMWDEELEELSQIWAENCIYFHDKNGHRKIPGRFSVGQNLAINYQDWNKTIYEWYIEHKDFVLGSGGQVKEKMIGHYVQLAYATAAKIGCGIATCNNGVESIHDYNDTATIFVCNYAFGVTNSKNPYREGSLRCEDCMGSCVDGLCDCQGKVCQNGGTLNLTSCECECQQSFAEPGSCGLNCGNVSDRWYCSTTYKFPQCLATANLADECPEFCQICPWGGFNYTEGSKPIPTTTPTPTTASSGTTTTPSSNTGGSATPNTLSPNTQASTTPNIPSTTTEDFVIPTVDTNQFDSGAVLTASWLMCVLVALACLTSF